MFGVPGNILTILVATMRHNRKHTTSVYMVGLAIPDALILIQQGIRALVYRSNVEIEIEQE
jgi:hypothetical protein